MSCIRAALRSGTPPQRKRNPTELHICTNATVEAVHLPGRLTDSLRLGKNRGASPVWGFMNPLFGA